MGADSADALHIQAKGVDVAASKDGLEVVERMFVGFLNWAHENQPIVFFCLFLFAWWLYLRHRRVVRRDEMRIEYQERRDNARVTAQMPLPLEGPGQRQLEDRR